MPGRWVGGPGSKACPTKDQIIEGRILDDDGGDDGTVLLVVKRFYTPGELGRFLLGDYISASSKSFRSWVDSRASGFSVTDGSYHLCKGNPAECPAVSRHENSTHIGKWRTWKEEELIAGGIPEYDRGANGLITRHFKGGEKGRGATESGLPWGRATGGPKVGVTDAGGGAGRKKDKPARDEAEVEESKGTVTRLKKELAALKAALGKAEADQEKKERTKPRKPRGRSKGGSEKEKPRKKKRKKDPFTEAGLPTAGGGGDPGDDAPDWGGSGDSSGEEETDEESEREDEERKPRKEEKRKKKERRGKGPASDDPDDEDDPSGGHDRKDGKGKRKKKKKKKERKDKKRDKSKRKERKMEKDKGPFGVAETRRVPKEESSSGFASESSSDSSQSFRKAPSGLTLHLRLQRYAMKHPGRLASRLLQRMAKATRFEGATSLTKRKGTETPACALTFFLTVLTPTLKDKWTPRTQRELRVLVEIMDKMASSQGPIAADIVAHQSAGAVGARRKSMEESEIPRDSRPGGSHPDRSGRSKHDAEGSGAGGSVEREDSMESVSMGERSQREGSEGRQGPERKRRKRRRKRKDARPGGGRQEGEMRHLPPPEPEHPPGRFKLFEAEREAELPDVEDELSVSEDAAEGFRKQERAEFQAEIKKALGTEFKMSQIGWQFLSDIKKLKTPLGRFYREFQKCAVAQGGPDLLPVSLKGIEELSGINSFVKDWAVMICLVLNFQFCGQSNGARVMEHPEKLTPRQEEAVRKNVIPAIERMIGHDPLVPSIEEIKEELERKGQDYDGSTWVVMEQLDYDQVLACWPDKTHAAVAPIEDFLTGPSREQILRPGDSILPFEEWPQKVPKSYVRADDSTWERLISEGYRRGLFQMCPDSEVLRSASGELILNGAGAVPKMKGGVKKQRFISIFCPLNAVSAKIEGAESTLPYVGQISLLEIPEEGQIVIDSEDMASAFNLFKMPEGWRGLFVYEKKVPARCLGGDSDDMVFAALRTVPMGWLSAVGVVQFAIRHLAFDVAKLPEEAEIQKWKEIPKGQKLLLYLDSVDQLRLVSNTMAKVVKDSPSPEHQKFSDACDQKGLPRNSAKSLAGALVGSLQGGELRSEEGVFMLHPEKMRMDIALCLYVLTMTKWQRRETSGLVGRLIFAGAFRRPLLAALEEIFVMFQKNPRGRIPSSRVVDEVLSMLFLLPLSFTNVRARICPDLHATDASPTGAGSCVAKQLKRTIGTPDSTDLTCSVCRREMGELIATGQEVDCPRGCGRRTCSVDCHLVHAPNCEHRGAAAATFSERWSGPNCPLSAAVVREGIEVLTPYDVRRDESMDFFTETGKCHWSRLDEEDADAEHHAPDCKTMSRARGRPFWIGNDYHLGPPALRDERNVMGFKGLTGASAVKVRQGNKMALKSIARCKSRHEKGKLFSLEHPLNSFLWYMKATVELAGMPGVRLATFSNCCFGGQRTKWTTVMTNSKKLYEALHWPHCQHAFSNQGYQPYYDEQGNIVFPTEEEAQYPEGLAQAYAKAIKEELSEAGMVPQGIEDARMATISSQLDKYHRMDDPELKAAMAQRIMEMERSLEQGKEHEALRFLLRNGHYRGTDIRLSLVNQGQRELIPYPAYRWLWRDVLSFRWKQEAHINELEAQALVAHVKRLLREKENQGRRFLVVLDSQVLYYAVGKGRSPSRRLNRILKRLSALVLFGDVYVLPVWTLSAWNYADIPSRRA